MKILKAEVVNCPIANTKWGQKRVLNCKLLPSKEKVACWSNDLNNPIYLSKKPGDIVELIEDDKGKFSVLDREPTTEQVPQHPLVPPQYSMDDIEGDLGLPHPLSDADKVRLSKLIGERAKLLSHTIEVMREEFDRKGLEFHEGSIRSLAVSLFIHISKHLD